MGEATIEAVAAEVRSLGDVKALAAIVLGLHVNGALPARRYHAWLIRLAHMFLQADHWPACLRFLKMVPPAYMRDLPDDAEADPELAERAYAVSRWLTEHMDLQDGHLPGVQILNTVGRV